MSDEQETPNREVAQISPLHASLMERIAGGSGRAGMTFDPTTPDGAKKFLQARLKELPNVKSLINKEVKITDFFTHDVSRSGDTAVELEEWQRTVIYDDKGNAYSCGSKGVWDSLVAFCAVRPRFPWNPPIKCTVQIKEMQGGKTWMWLDPDLDSILANAQTQRKPK